MVAMDPALMTNTELATDALLRRYDFELTAEHRSMLGRYRVRVRRARWCGVLGVILAGIYGLLDASDQLIPLLLTGYLLGSTLAEVFVRGRRSAGALRGASLSTRQPSLLLPGWARVLPWIVLVPLLASLLLLIGDHPEGVTRARDASGSCFARAVWFPTSNLVLTALVAAVGFGCWRLTLARLTRRRLPADHSEAARLDLLTRALSARAVSGTTAALGLSLLSGLAELASPVLHSSICTSVTDTSDLYALGSYALAIATLGGLAFWSSIAVFLLSRRPRVDTATLSAATDPPR